MQGRHHLKNSRIIEYRYKEEALWSEMNTFYASEENQCKLLSTLIQMNAQQKTMNGPSTLFLPFKPISSLSSSSSSSSFSSSLSDPSSLQIPFSCDHMKQFSELPMMNWSIRNLTQDHGVAKIRQVNCCFFEKERNAAFFKSDLYRWLLNSHFASLVPLQHYCEHSPLMMNGQQIYDKFIQRHQTFSFDFFRRRKDYIGYWFLLSNRCFFLSTLGQLNAFYFLLNFHLWERIPYLPGLPSSSVSSSSSSPSSSCMDDQTSSNGIISTKQKRKRKRVPPLSKKKGLPIQAIFTFECNPNYPVYRCTPFDYYANTDIIHTIANAPDSLPDCAPMVPLPFFMGPLTHYNQMENTFTHSQDPRQSKRKIKNMELLS